MPDLHNMNQINFINKIQFSTMKMKRIFLALSAIFFTLGAQAQLFWKVSGNGLAKPSYLFGTHHLIEKEKIAGFDKVLAVIPQTDAIVGEMDMSNMLGMQLKMVKHIMMKDTTMRDLLSAEEYEMVDIQCKEVLGKGLDKLGKMKPILISTLLQVKLYMKHNNLKKEPEAIDIILQKEGKKEKKNIIGLETVEEQIDVLFNSVSLKSQAESLVESAKDKDKTFVKFNELNDAYLKGDLNTLSRLAEPMTAEEKRMFIDKRNNNWVIQLKTILPTQSCLVAVGCMHLVDETGLVQQLRNAGFTVEAVDIL